MYLYQWDVKLNYTSIKTGDRKSRKMRILSLALIVLVTSVSAEQKYDSLQILKSNLKSMIETVSDKEIRFCPSEKCNVYKTESSTPDFFNYIFLDIYHSNEYVTLEELVKKEKTFHKNTAASESKVRSDMESYCKKSEKDITCILQGMKEALKISTCLGNFDEGHYCEVCDGNTLCEKL